MNLFIRHLFAAIGTLSLLAAPASAASCWNDLNIDPLNLLFWNEQEKLCGFQNMEHLWPSNTVSKGAAPISPLAGNANAVPPVYRDRAEAFMKKNGVHGLLIMQKDVVMYESYQKGFTENSRWTSFSMAKSLTGLLAGAAVADGCIKSLDDRVAVYLPELAKGAYSTATVRHVLTMSSGVAWNENYLDPKSDVARLAAFADDTDEAFLAYMSSRPRVAKAGGVFNYSTGEANLVGHIVRRATGKTLAAYMSEKIWSKLGMEEDAIWMTNRSGAEVSGCCFSATLRDYARIGRFMLRKGAVGGEAVLPSWWMKEMTRASAPSRKQRRPYGYQIWVQGNDSYQASGIFGQMIHMNPANETVIVMLGAWDAAVGTMEQYQARREFIAEVNAALAPSGKWRR